MILHRCDECSTEVPRETPAIWVTGPFQSKEFCDFLCLEVWVRRKVGLRETIKGRIEEGQGDR